MYKQNCNILISYIYYSEFLNNLTDSLKQINNTILFQECYSYKKTENLEYKENLENINKFNIIICFLINKCSVFYSKNKKQNQILILIINENDLNCNYFYYINWNNIDYLFLKNERLIELFHKKIKNKNLSVPKLINHYYENESFIFNNYLNIIINYKFNKKLANTIKESSSFKNKYLTYNYSKNKDNQNINVNTYLLNSFKLLNTNFIKKKKEDFIIGILLLSNIKRLKKIINDLLIFYKDNSISIYILNFDIICNKNLKFKKLKSYILKEIKKYTNNSITI